MAPGSKQRKPGGHAGLDACHLQNHDNATLRRRAIQHYAKTERDSPNKGQALINIIAMASGLARGITPAVPTNAVPYHRRHAITDYHLKVQKVASLLIGDLESVLIGDDMLEGRGKGPFYAGYFKGAQGFKLNLRDPYNQVQHATAGLVIGYRYGTVGEWGARFLEEEDQDDRLYAAACPVGQWLSANPTQYLRLSEEMGNAICDSTCKPAEQWLLQPPKCSPAGEPRLGRDVRWA